MKKLVIGFVLFAVLVAAIWYAPKYLAYADLPVKSDVIVLFVGSKDTTPQRQKEAIRLMEEGYARHLLIPAYGQVFDVHSASRIQQSSRIRLLASTPYPSYFEDTHIEMLEAKKEIDNSGFKSAIFVSSPFHMRRIKIMADMTFENSRLKMKCVPSRYIKWKGRFLIFQASVFKNIANEYGKLIWFLAYKSLCS